MGKIYTMAEVVDIQEANRKKLIKKGLLKFEIEQERLARIEQEELQERAAMRRRAALDGSGEKGKKLRAVYGTKKLTRWI